MAKFRSQTGMSDSQWAKSVSKYSPKVTPEDIAYNKRKKQIDTYNALAKSNVDLINKYRQQSAGYQQTADTYNLKKLGLSLYGGVLNFVRANEDLQTAKNQSAMKAMSDVSGVTPIKTKKTTLTKGINLTSDKVLNYQKKLNIAPDTTNITDKPASSLGVLSDIEHGKYGMGGSFVTATGGGVIRLLEDAKAIKEGKTVSKPKAIADLTLAGLDIATVGGTSFFKKPVEKIASKVLVEQGTKALLKKSAITLGKDAATGAIGAGAYAVSAGQTPQEAAKTVGIGTGLTTLLSAIGLRGANKGLVKNAEQKVLGGALAVPRKEVAKRMSLVSDITDLSRGKYGITKKNSASLINNPNISTEQLQNAVSELKQEGTWSKASRPKVATEVPITTEKVLGLPSPGTGTVSKNISNDDISYFNTLKEQEKEARTGLAQASIAKAQKNYEPGMEKTVDKQIKTYKNMLDYTSKEQEKLIKANPEIEKVSTIVPEQNKSVTDILNPEKPTISPITETKQLATEQANPYKTTVGKPSTTVTRKPNSWYISEQLKGNKVSSEGEAFTRGATQGASTPVVHTKEEISNDIVSDVKNTPSKKKILSGAGSIYRRNPIEQVFQDILGKNYEKFNQKYLQPFFESKGAMATARNQKYSEVYGIVDKLGLKSNKDYSLIQKLGEKVISYDDLVAKVGEKKASKIASAEKQFRNLYDKWFDELQQLVPGVQKREDYFRHFNDFSNTVKQVISPVESVSGIVNNKQRNKTLGIAQKRLGEKTDYNAVKGIINYIDALEYQKNINPHISTFRDIAEGFKRQGNMGASKFMDDYANNLLGKKSKVDEAIYDNVPHIFNALKFVNRKSKLALILGNMAQPLVQAANIGNVVANVGKINYARSFGNFLKDSVDGYKFQDATSNFLRERFAMEKTREKLLNVGVLGKPEKFMKDMLTFSDEVVARSGWQAAYEDGIRKGLTSKEASSKADYLIRDAIAGRGVGEIPLNQATEFMQELAPFTLEVQNSMRKYVTALKGVGNKDKVAHSLNQIATMAVTSFVLNQIYNASTGQKINFDPISATIDAYDIVKDPNMSVEEKALKSGGRMLGEYLGSVPYGQQLAGLVPEDGNTLTGGLSRKEIFGTEDPTRYGTGVAGMLAYKPVAGLVSDLTKVKEGKNVKSPLDITADATKDILTYSVPGGKQVRKTGESIADLMRGFTVSQAGNKQYETPTNPVSVTKALLFGKSSTKEAKQYYDNNEKIYTIKNKTGVNTISNDDVQEVNKVKSTGGDVSKTEAARKLIIAVKNAKKAGKSKETIDKMEQAMTSLGINKDRALSYSKQYDNERLSLRNKMTKQEKQLSAFSEKERNQKLKEMGKTIDNYPRVKLYVSKYK